MAPPATAKPVAFKLHLKLQSFDGDAEPFKEIECEIVDGKTTLWEGTTSATGEVEAELPGHFFKGELVLKGDNYGWWAVPLFRWPVPPEPAAGGPGGQPPEEWEGNIAPNSDRGITDGEAEAKRKRDADARARKEAKEAQGQKQQADDVLRNLSLIHI